jgi:hypothetical protein
MSIRDAYHTYTAPNGLPGTPQSYLAYNGGVTRPALLIFRCYMQEPILERPPTIDEMRLLCEYCAYWINQPGLIFPPEVLAVLRYEIERIKTPYELAVWRDGCKKAFGLEPLGGL